ncbi:uncharacterized protein LOC132398475 [Hypanus sabinus]|uniref:uncharacterized protein LOC132398475 n=1 Tax=Hypanus sabinus TaxID=79690 RepID=UPI0028C49C35|nr:uncharacterized protein LOC132398475 [Hypanus sabinus]XP_059833957.1 uncharacterized protein LOC132398475 [Hypanus sabinus]XP_059833958.1 uncharacterized protein LOC132398475 [Hypanus sabinus]XP_059833959.1 uncharacterized protein LOC132398475 [Hypanus sabinus]XP_059833961.1 uncharacterized protein LOC132398475 [Hypanus sabinus]XP_059833962.1 uncharacterized protein LOC132398475 [Hypanus sabinus]
MILNRIHTAIHPKLRFNQNGFQQKCTTVMQILALRRIIKKVKKNNLPAVLTFIDFRKAFDSIHRGEMLKILKAYEVPDHLLRTIESSYTETMAEVVSPDGEIAVFELLAAVLQGDTLAPYIFIIVLDYALRQATKVHDKLGFTIKPARTERIRPVMLTDLDFAEGIVLLSDQMEEAQQLLTKVEIECNKVGLHLNAKKTEYMAFNCNEGILKTVKNDTIKKVLDFKYLGSRMLSLKKDIKIRKVLAWSGMNDMKEIWSSNLTRGLKKRIFLAVIVHSHVRMRDVDTHQDHAKVTRWLLYTNAPDGS